MVATIFAGGAFAAPAPNSRTTALSTVQRNDTRDTKREVAVTDETMSRSAVRRGSVPVVTSRSAATPIQGIVSGRAARQSVSASRGNDTVTARTGATPAATARSATSARSAVVSGATQSRSARATAVFDDVTKMGSGYANCRDAYNTCMDQFCAGANDTFRRCFCSDKITGFRDTEAALDQAKIMLQQFEDNNLNAIDKTAGEVTAMYSATVGERAIRSDPTAAQNTLNEIADILSGRKKATAPKITALELDFTMDMDAIWGDSSSSVFGGVSDLSAKEGVELYNIANNQCVSVVGESCANSATASMARNAYNVLINQDCNLYEKKLNTTKEKIATTVRDAEKILRQARLEEYRSHNSADVNECVSKVKTAVTGDAACGTNYKKCLDYTGSYIDMNTGNPIYSPQLFKLSELLKLDGTGNIAQTNPQYNKFMDGRRMFAESALDTCRDKANIVWEEFKRTALIEIAQAQDAKIEEVKSTCVTTMAECYDSQSGQLNSFDGSDKNTRMSGALNAYASRSMCADKVAACAALYGSPTENQKCNFDNNGRLTNPTQCGMTALLGFVSTVDNIKVAKGCEEAILNYATETCTPTDGKHEYPYACRLWSEDKLREELEKRRDMYCKNPTTGQLEIDVSTTIDGVIEEVNIEITNTLHETCATLGGIWDKTGTNTDGLLQVFVQNVYGGAAPTGETRGSCHVDSIRNRCEKQDVLTGSNGYAKYVNGECVFSPEWYKYRCEISLNGYWDSSTCYVK